MLNNSGESGVPGRPAKAAGRWLAILAMLFLPAGAVSQEPAASSGLADIAGQIRTLEARLGSALGAERDSIRQRLRTQRRLYREGAWQYVDTLDPEDAADRDAGAGILEGISAALGRQLEAGEERIGELRALTDSSDGAAAAQAREDLRLAESHRMELLEAMVTNITRMDRYGLPSGEDAARAGALLRNRAQLLSGRIELQSLRRDDIAVTMEGLDPESPEYADARRQRIAIDAAVVRSGERLSGVANLLERLGTDVAEYRQTAFMATGDLSAEILDRQVVGSVLARWLTELRTGFLRHGPDILTRLVVVAVILAVFWLLARVVRAMVRRGLDNLTGEMSTLARDFLVGLSAKAVLITGILVALSQFGLQIGPLLAGLGIVGFIVGFALQDTLSNFASGIMILIYRPFDVGDYVEAAGVQGEVKHMNLVSTTVHTPQNHRLVIPNNRIWGNIIRNITSQDMRRVDLSVGVSYEDDIERVEALLAEIVAAEDRVKSEPEPTIRLHNLGESAVEFTVRVWVDSTDYMGVFWDLTRRIKIRFDEEGISFPYPQRTVHLVSADGDDERS
ncbi:MAG: mechanosensitive ion channel family protein [Gammaproteobacteria bacterium]|nr:mechanosensitive ion channel family protein [Gammaproteobacteria bacterium]MXY65271.1 mechanosensitive ion channel family protein [Gammaproteobacteria bacterium]MYG66172.1 mechanosensitive ion channel family protein [Gammaproteobacteria bacterium]